MNKLTGHEIADLGQLRDYNGVYFKDEDILSALKGLKEKINKFSLEHYDKIYILDLIDKWFPIKEKENEV